MDIIKLEKGQLSIIEGKTAAGKTMAMLVDAKYYVDFKLSVLFFTLEQPVTRLINKFFDKVKAKTLHLDYMHACDMAFSLETIERVILDAKDKIEVIYIDSLQNIIVNEKCDNPHQLILSRLTKLAKEINLPIVISSQVSPENDSITNINIDKVIDELRGLFGSQEEFEAANKHLVLRDFSGFESYDYFSSTVHIVNNDLTLTRFNSFNLSDYFNN